MKDGEKSFYERHKRMLLYCAVLGAISLVSMIASSLVIKKWAQERNIVACVPADVEHAFPQVYRQTAFNPTTNEALVKSFVYEYVSLTQNEQIIDYHRLTNNSRYKYNLLKKSLEQAINMSLGPAEKINMRRLEESPNVYERLKKGNYGWVFLVDDILLKFLPETGLYMAVIRGHHQVTYDRAKNPDIPHDLWGYKEIHLLIQKGESRGDSVNKYGLYVSQEWVYDIDAKTKRKYDSKVQDHYLSNN